MFLSIIQYRILAQLAAKMSNLVTFRELLEHTWGEHSMDTRAELYVYVNRIREKLEDDRRNPKCLVTVRGKGYILHPRLETTHYLELNENVE